MLQDNFSKGISWFDDCRIPHNEDLTILRDEKKLDTQNQGWGFKSVSRDNSGRFPANLLVSDDMLNDGIITKVQDNLKEKTKQYKGGNFGGGSVKNNFYFGDKGTNSRYYDIDKWFDKIIN